MKIEQGEPAFKPVVITLETPNEVSQMLWIIDMGIAKWDDSTKKAWYSPDRYESDNAKLNGLRVLREKLRQWIP